VSRRDGKTAGSVMAGSAPTEKAGRQAIAGVILCGGKGKRMGRTSAHKVCVPLVGRPAVVRLIDTLRADGVDPLAVVVGHQAWDVVETVGAAHPGVHFVYQRDQLGTGHAARIGVEALCRFGYEGPVLVTMGDKWFGPGLISKALRRFRRSGADLVVVSSPKGSSGGTGRLVRLPGRGVVGIVELRDIQRARVLGDWLALASNKTALTRSGLRRAGLKRIGPATKLWRALGPLARFSRGSGSVQASELTQVIRETGLAVRAGDSELAPDQVERCSPTVNESVYIADAAVLQAALRRVGRDNAQDEYYLTDVIEIIAGHHDASPSGPRGRVVEYRLRHDEVMAFNTRAELRRIERRVLRLERDDALRAADRRLAACLRTPDQWFALLDPSSARGRRVVERAYGVGGPLVTDRMRALGKVVRLFARRHGRGRRLFLVRAPGRINLMGRHVDHQGGLVHAMALDCEIVMAVAPRKDDVIRIVNADPVAFGPRELVLNDWRGLLATFDWLGFVDHEAVRAYLTSTSGDWSNYVLAAALYQQHRHPDRRLRGMDLAVHGNVPMAAGLSSSSSLVVASMEAITAVNGIAGGGSDIVSACGQAEWFVGSRGGSADHAAIRLARAGHVARMGFLPFRLSRYVPIPADAAVLLAYSGEHAVKIAGARDRFNERVACYRLGILLLQRRWPRLAPRLEYVRDLLPSRLGLGPGEVRRMLDRLPEYISRAALRRQLGGSFADRLDRVFSSHRDPGGYTIRDVMTFGVGECERSRMAASRLQRNDLAGFGELMLISHEGDRVSARGGRKGYPPGDAAGPVSRPGPLYRLVGAYGCSTVNLDRLVDLARAAPGVYGAQLAGAGLGGCVMILARRDAAARVKKALARSYYQPRGMAPAVWRVRSVCGGGTIRP